MAVKVHHEAGLGALPLLDAAGAGAGKGELGGVGGEGADALLVVGEDAHGLAGGEVPEADGGVEGGGDDLGVGLLALEVGDGRGVAREDVDVAAGAHVPDAGDAVAAAGDEDVEGGVDVEGVDAAQVAVVVADDLVGLEVPALDHLVLAAGEEVRVARRHGQAADGADVARQRQLEPARRQVPDLDGPVPGAAGEPLVVRLHRQRPHPPQVPGYHPHQLPRRVPLGPDVLRPRRAPRHQAHRLAPSSTSCSSGPRLPVAVGSGPFRCRRRRPGRSLDEFLLRSRLRHRRGPGVAALAPLHGALLARQLRGQAGGQRLHVGVLGEVPPLHHGVGEHVFRLLPLAAAAAVDGPVRGGGRRARVQLPRRVRVRRDEGRELYHVLGVLWHLHDRIGFNQCGIRRGERRGG